MIKYEQELILSFQTSNEILASPDVGSAPTPGLAITLAPTIPVYDSNGDFAGPIGSGYSDRNNPVLMQYLNRWDNTNRLSFLWKYVCRSGFNGKPNIQNKCRYRL